MTKSLLASICAGVAMVGSSCTQAPGVPSASFAAPVGAGPSDGATFNYSAQPITVTVANAVRTTATSVTYTIEVASDSGFSNIVFTKSDIPEDAAGTTSVQIGQLGGNTKYYWRSRANLDGVDGVPSTSRSFQVQPQVVLGVPSLGSPEANGTATDLRPTFRVNNSTKSGPAGSVVYEFQVSASSSFSPLVASGTVPEQSGQTAWTANVDLPAGTYFWRAQATDPSNDVKSGFSGNRSFTLEPFSLKHAIIHNNPPDIGSWPETARITWIDLTTYGRIVVDFDKRLGPGRWPDVHPAGWDGALQYTLGLCFFINKAWHCSAAIQFWHERDLTEGGDVDLVWADWFFDERWGEMKNYQPKPGEIVGVFVVAGNVRDAPSIAVKERSNVQFTPWGTNFVLGR